LTGTEHGIKAAIRGSITGFVLSALISALSMSLGPSGYGIVVVFNLFAIIFTLTQSEKMKYWSLSYTVGYFFGILLFGRFLMEGWELALYLMIASPIMARKIWKKIK